MAPSSAESRLSWAKAGPVAAANAREKARAERDVRETKYCDIGIGLLTTVGDGLCKCSIAVTA